MRQTVAEGPLCSAGAVDRARGRGRALAGAILLAAALAGCGQVVRRADLPQVKSLVAERGVSGDVEWRDDRAAAEQAAAVDRILASDLTPDSAVQVALLENPSLQATYEELGIAQANLVQAGLLANPSITGAALFGGVSPAYDFDLVQSFLGALLIPARTRIAGAESEAARLRVAGEVVGLAARVRAAYFRLQGAEQLVAVLQSVLAATEAAGEFADELHRAGNLSDLQRASQHALVEDVRTDLLRAQGAIVEPREDLRELLGPARSNRTFKVPAALPELPARDPALADVLARASSDRLELAAARKEQAALAESLDTARTWRFLGDAGIGSNTHREQGKSNWISGPALTLSLPIFDQKQAEIARLESELQQSARRADALAESVAAEARRAYGKLESARRLAEHGRSELIPARERVVELTHQFYDFMLLGAFDLLAARRAEISAYGSTVEAVRDYWIARAEIDKAVGAHLPIESGGAAAAAEPSPAAEAAPASPSAGATSAGEPAAPGAASPHAGHHHHGGS